MSPLNCSCCDRIKISDREEDNFLKKVFETDDIAKPFDKDQLYNCKYFLSAFKVMSSAGKIRETFFDLAGIKMSSSEIFGSSNYCFFKENVFIVPHHTMNGELW